MSAITGLLTKEIKAAPRVAVIVINLGLIFSLTPTFASWFASKSPLGTLISYLFILAAGPVFISLGVGRSFTLRNRPAISRLETKMGFIFCFLSVLLTLGGGIGFFLIIICLFSYFGLVRDEAIWKADHPINSTKLEASTASEQSQ